MSGRIYDDRKGIPICNDCGKYALRSDETNFNGAYCNNCKSTNIDKFNEEHPIWIAWMNYHKSRQGKIIDFTYTLTEFKKDYEFSRQRL